MRAHSFSDELETHSVLTKIVRLFTVPILNFVPDSWLQKIMKKTSQDAGTVVHKGGSTHALEAMYTRYHRGLFSRGIIQGVSDVFWHHVVSQPKAIRNRLRIVKRIMSEKVTLLVSSRCDKGSNEPISVLSVAGGSSRSIIHMVSDMKVLNVTHPIEVVTIDKDKTALDVGIRVARENGVSNNFSWIGGKASDIVELVPNKMFDIVEVVGLLDYFSEERTQRLLEGVKRIMKEGGYVIAANVVPNSEMMFVKKTGWPDMYYRKPEEFKQIFIKAGFRSDVELIVEPLGVHMVAVAKK